MSPCEQGTAGIQGIHRHKSTPEPERRHSTPPLHITAKMALVFPPPSSVKGMKNLNKEAFKSTFIVPALKIDAVHCNKLRKALCRALVHQAGIKDVAKDPSDQTKRIILLDPKFQTANEFTEKEQAVIKESNGEFIQHDLNLTYDHYPADQILNAVMPDEIEVTKSFETVGHIAHMNLKEDQLPYKHIIGEVILDKNPSIKTVVNKTNKIEETFRFFKMELLAGEDKTFACVKQIGCKFEFDFAKVYWNSRLETEHKRIVNLLKPGDVVCDVFAGVGPFAIPAAKKGCIVHANDLNPESYTALKHNAVVNKVKDHIIPYNMDGREFLKKLFKLQRTENDIVSSISQIHHVIMNLPVTATDFLDVFKETTQNATNYGLNNSTYIHCYCFSKSSDPHADAKERVEQTLGRDVDDCNVHLVRNVAPKLLMMCVSFKLGHGHQERTDIVDESVSNDPVGQGRGIKRRAEEL